MSTHFTGLRIGQIFEFQDARHAKDHVLEPLFDPKSEQEVEGFEYIVKPCRSIEMRVYKDTKHMTVPAILVFIS